MASLLRLIEPYFYINFLDLITSQLLLLHIYIIYINGLFVFSRLIKLDIFLLKYIFKKVNIGAINLGIF